MKRILLCFIILVFSNVMFAQVGSVDTTKQDSIERANQKMYNDSLNAAKKKAASSAQHGSTDTRPFLKRWRFDVYTSFWVNPSNTYFEFSPILSYRFPRIYSIGAGPTYLLNRNRNQNINMNGWGAKVVGRAQVTKWLYGYTEYQGINNQYVSGIDPDSQEIIRSNQYVPSWFVSIGVNIRIGKRHGFNFQALYDLLYDSETSPYYSSWIYRVGFGF